MLRLTEAALTAVPLVLFLIWSIFLHDRLPPRVLGVSYALVAVAALALIWFGLGRSLSPGRPYVPAHLAPNGAVVGQ
ncbi:MAG TPA: hypothetical protein VFA03_06600 [Acetobacteraceae bacterium]|nr:hypothetical protein [Acetobacteraceae bacterium]